MIEFRTKDEFDAWVARVRDVQRRVKEIHPDINVGLVIEREIPSDQFRSRIETTAPNAGEFA